MSEGKAVGCKTRSEAEQWASDFVEAGFQHVVVTGRIDGVEVEASAEDRWLVVASNKPFLPVDTGEG